MNKLARCIAAAALVGVALSFVACAPTPSKLVVTSESSFDFDGGRAEDVMYWVPLDAPIEEISVGSSTSGGCSEELTSWLNDHGTLIATPQAILIQQTADATGEDEVSIAVDGTFREAEPGFVVQCGRPSIDGGGGSLGELAWTLALLRFEEGSADFFEPTAEGPRPMTLHLSNAPVGLLAILQGSEAFEGRVLLATDGGGIPLPVIGLGGQESTDLYWPGIPPLGTLRVAIAEDSNGEVAFLCSAAGAAPYDVEPCDPSAGPPEDQIRQQAVLYRENFLKAQERERLREDEPLSSEVPGTETVLTRLEPWDDPQISSLEPSSAVQDCYRDMYRSDRVSCPTSVTCYLNEDETLGACQSSGHWEVHRMEGIVSLAPDPEAVMDVESLVLTDGTACRFHTGAGPMPPDGFDGWVGSCAEGTEVLWASNRADMPLGQSFLFSPSTGGEYLRVATGPEGEQPTYREVAEVRY